MHLKRLTIKGFRSYKTEQTLDLDQVPPGLYHIKGTNGAGKSSLFDALHWVWFGETSRGLKAGTVSNWKGEEKGYTGMVEVDDLEVSRSWSPNSLQLNGVETDQEQLNTMLRLSSEIALHTYYPSQFATFFLDLKPTPRMDLYAEVLGLYLWERKSDTAKKLAKDYAQEGQRLEVEEARLQERAKVLAASANDTSNIDLWNESRDKKVKGLDKPTKLAEEAVKTATTDAIELLGTSKKHAQALEKLQKAIKALEDKRSSIVDGMEKQRGDLIRIRTRVSMEEGFLEQFNSMATGSCPSCSQPLTPEYKEKHKKELKLGLGTLSTQAKKIQKEVDALGALKTEVVKEIGKLEASPIMSEGNKLNKALQDSDWNVKNKTRELASILKQQKELRAEINPYVEVMKQARKNADTARKEAAKTTKELEGTRTLQASFEFWTKGFKEVRFQILQESLTQLNAEVNESLHDLGLAGWTLEFVVEQETKSGTVRAGFHCLVRSPESPDKPVPWEAWSGGETQRLRLGAQLGVSNCFRSRLGVDPDFEFWDEPTTGLNEEGIKDMLAILQERAQRYSRRILLADHRSLDFDFDGVVEVEKTEQGSIINMEIRQ